MQKGITYPLQSPLIIIIIREGLVKGKKGKSRNIFNFL